MLNKFVIETGDKLYLCIRRLKEDHIKKIDGWEDILKSLYKADRIFKKDGLLFLVQDIQDATEL